MTKSEIMSLVEEYIEYYRRKKTKTKKDRKNILDKFKRDVGKNLDEVKRKNVQDWIEQLDNSGIKRSSINQYLSVIKHFYKWLSHELPQPVGQEEMREVFKKQKQFGRIQDIERLEEKSEEEEKAFNIKEILKLVRNVNRKVHGKIFTLLSYFGLRRDELRLLTKNLVDFENNKITILREMTKTPAGDREIPFHPWIGELLKESKGNYIVGGRSGKKSYSPSFFHWKQYDDVLDSHFKTHTFRNTFGTMMRPILQEKLGNASGDYMLKKLMGHKTSGGDMSNHHFKKPDNFEENKRKAMNQWHYFSKNNMFEKLEGILDENRKA